MSAAPYPADTRAKGWRFELDYEQVEQSSTWALAGAEVRPWLLMLWMTAWRQVPCGSMPADEEVIAALIGMSPKLWAKHRRVLLRGWAEADDGRMYHATITTRVLEMLEYRAKQAKRVADFKARQREQRGANTLPPREPPDSNDTGTGTGTGTNTQKQAEVVSGTLTRAPGPPPDLQVGPPQESPEPGVSPGAAACIAMRRAGLSPTGLNPSHPRLLALVAAGAGPAEFAGFVPKAQEQAPGREFTYILGCVEGERRRAANGAAALHRGPMPNRQEALEQRNKAVAARWLASEGVTTQ